MVARSLDRRACNIMTAAVLRLGGGGESGSPPEAGGAAVGAGAHSSGNQRRRPNCKAGIGQECLREDRERRLMESSFVFPLPAAGLAVSGKEIWWDRCGELCSLFGL